MKELQFYRLGWAERIGQKTNQNIERFSGQHPKLPAAMEPLKYIKKEKWPKLQRLTITNNK